MTIFFLGRGGQSGTIRHKNNEKSYMAIQNLSQQQFIHLTFCIVQFPSLIHFKKSSRRKKSTDNKKNQQKDERTTRKKTSRISPNIIHFVKLLNYYNVQPSRQSHFRNSDINFTEHRMKREKKCRVCSFYRSSSFLMSKQTSESKLNVSYSELI